MLKENINNQQVTIRFLTRSNQVFDWVARVFLTSLFFVKPSLVLTLDWSGHDSIYTS